MNEELNLNIIKETTENNITYENTATTTYEVANNIHTMLSVLTFVIIIIFLYKYLKTNFSLRK